MENEVYTREDWSRDRNFNAAIGQEISPEIYEEMFECLPPRSFMLVTPMNKRLGILTGFRVGEPYAHAKSLRCGTLMAFNAAFGKTASGRCYFLGYQNQFGEIFDLETGKAEENK